MATFDPFRVKWGDNCIRILNFLVVWRWKFLFVSLKLLTSPTTLPCYHTSCRWRLNRRALITLHSSCPVSFDYWQVCSFLSASVPLHRLQKATAVPFANQAIVLKVHHSLPNCFRVLFDTLILYLTPVLFADLRPASHLESIVSIHRSLSSTVSTMIEQQDSQINIHGTSILAEYELQSLLITSSRPKFWLMWWNFSLFSCKGSISWNTRIRKQKWGGGEIWPDEILQPCCFKASI